MKTKEKITDHIRTSEDHINKITTMTNTPSTQPTLLPNPTTTATTAITTTTTTYASALINPPPHANLKIAEREGIKARQFLIEGTKKSRISNLDMLQTKLELNKIITELGIQKGKIQSVTNTRNGGTTIEMDTDKAATLIANINIQRKICNKIGEKVSFKARTYDIIAFNIPLSLEPSTYEHQIKICKANNLDTDTITKMKWAKAINKRSPMQKSAHLKLTTNNAYAANRAITNGATQKKSNTNPFAVSNAKAGIILLKTVLRKRIHVVIVQKTTKPTNAQQIPGNATHAEPQTTQAGAKCAQCMQRKLKN